VLTQSRQAEEIIVVDDGSEDKTEVLLKEQYPTVRVISQANAGVSAARNRGIEAATGDWIALLDSDDEWRPQKLARQSALLSDTPEAALCHSDESWIRNGKHLNQMKKHKKSGGYIYSSCLPLCAISPSAALIRKTIFDEVGLFDESLPACEDYDMWLRICARHPVAFVSEPLVIKYGGHDDQLSAKHWGMDRFRVQALQRALREAPLGADDRSATREMLVRKLKILAAGARKRGRADVAEKWRREISEWA
jgi:glycosyltransferase involved in cell wall biosynthesis